MRFCLACLTESYSFAMTVKTYDVTSQPRPQGFSLKKWVGPFSMLVTEAILVGCVGKCQSIKKWAADVS